MNSKRRTKGGSGAWRISVSGTQKSFIRLPVVKGCSISSDNSRHPIGIKMKCDSASGSALSSTLRSSETERPEEPSHYWSPLVATKTSFLSGPEVTPEGRCDGGPRSVRLQGVIPRSSLSCLDSHAGLVVLSFILYLMEGLLWCKNRSRSIKTKLWTCTGRTWIKHSYCVPVALSTAIVLG